MATLVLRRGYDSGGALRRLSFRLDNDVVARLRPNREVRIEVPAGEHTLQVAMDWATSEPMSVLIEEDETVCVLGAIQFSMILKVFYRPRTALKLVVTRQARR
ncbi:DUF4399 domain-containing protein [Mumia sp. zg.B17]|uniref:DUF4399 domain-containing protein n=1 Tax=unclassified Mumia TaxID=2621872 RepID=UPI001C6DF5BA|nr:MULTISPECIES: DUF4399 domain-containing protein [unclassified Mumia]MBW9204588.1 DUF4399 domain-containing protein [Mumia sp. zg.B17]MBW9209407.1 DUF4399 domain-containing protein [Mumia sp. zg.B21]